ncbi:MAG: oxidoreductase [Rhizobiaceae bacterium]
MVDCLEDMVLVITGAASGIGRAIAERAVERGAVKLLLTDMDKQGLQKAASDLPSHVQVATIIADLSDATAADKITEAAISTYGRIDGLVNSAGVTTRASFMDGTSEDWDRIFAINARAPYLLMQAAIKDMLSRKSQGSIVNIQSVNAQCGIAELAIYSASKGALQTLTKNAANAHMGDGIRVNGINLGWTLTEAENHMQANILGLGENWTADAAKDTPLGRLLQPEEAANLTVYLLDPVSAPLSGASIDLTQGVVGAPS